ncbi:hemin transporter [Streptomyces sp. SID4946]|uniref:globin domain-containing protein n=1 Tax=Streptomyces sp. LamerLS-31b TaxID=1839765 RepID=UPI00081F51B1|nr:MULTISPECIES: globin domain-containing protein [unclassified Streptomyces]MYQ96022.1 hemin transporter [Streptomyces sp. SID4946]SCF95162.1 nitric oxide dioxygenase [Streptomyces sp. LamerLS-31b]SCF98835.1 nitric oxide dioxygenase [Streptomyces sp. DconLS]
MLSEQSAATVRATLPAVEAAIEQITERFYARLFDAHPELLRDLFNRGNQASGAQKSALAGSIAAFAGHLVEHPDQRPDAMLSRIAHKHASLGVVPEQYPVVHEHLFAAVAEILGDAVTPEVAAAWTEVYWLMANALIAIEKRLYEESGRQEFRKWEVVGREEETADVVSFRVRPVDGSPVRGFRAGQYVSVGVKLADGARQIRQYSLSGAPGEDVRQFSVKRVHGGATPDGEVSSQLHARVRVGDVLELSEPYGDLVLDGVAGRPLLLASAGIGVTPMVAMLASLAADGHDAPVTVVHGDRSPADHALRVDHQAYADKLADSDVTFFYERDAEPGGRTGLVDLSGIDIAPGTCAYLCGPLPFMRAVRGQLIEKGVAPADIHYEVFGPDLWLDA